TVRRVVGVERDRQEPLLAAAHDLPADVEERRRADVPAREDADPAGLLDDVEVAGLAGRRGRVHRRLEVRDADEVQRGRPRSGAGHDRERGADGSERPHSEKTSSRPLAAWSFAFPSGMTTWPSATIGLCQCTGPVGRLATRRPLVGTYTLTAPLPAT